MGRSVPRVSPLSASTVVAAGRPNSMNIDRTLLLNVPSVWNPPLSDTSGSVKPDTVSWPSRKIPASEPEMSILLALVALRRGPFKLAVEN